MPNKVINGTLLPVQQQPSNDYDPQRGLLGTVIYEGCDEAAAVSVENTLLSERIAFTSHSDGKTRVIEAKIMNAPLDVWQVLANEIQKSGYENPAVLANADGTTDQDAIAKIKQYVLDNTKLSAINPPLTGNALKLFFLMQHDQDHYALGQYVLRHTVQTSETFGSNVSDVNVEKLYTTAQLLVEVTNPLLWTFPLPGRLQTKLNSIPAPAAVANFLWSWRKLPSTEVMVPGNFIEITTEYWLEQWSTFYYTPLPP